MKQHSVNGAVMPYIDIGRGTLLVCVHGSLCDFRSWSPILGPLSRWHRVIAPSLRHYFPAHWDGVGPGFTIDQHVADMIVFIEALGLGPVDLMGHSRGGHIAFRVAGKRPDLVRKLILAEPGGEMDASLAPAAAAPRPGSRGFIAEAAEKIAAGDVEGGLASFFDAIEGPGAWRRIPAAGKQQVRDNAYTLLGQIDEQRQPFTRAEAERLGMPTLFIGGEKTLGALPAILKTLAAHVKGSRVVMIPNATHPMFEQDPVAFSAAVLDFLAPP
jgi:pimeloyl-ACP methyl ester carboxylesterase